MFPKEHQFKLSNIIASKIKEYNWCYLAGQERTGKTLSVLLACEELPIKNIVVITKIKAIDGWQDHINKCHYLTKSYKFIAYTQLHKHQKLHCDLVVLDEAHVYLSGYPKPTKTKKLVKKLCKKKPVIFVSATPHAQGYQKLYGQLDCCTYNCWNEYKTFNDWFYDFCRRTQDGLMPQIRIHAGLIYDYKKINCKKVEPYLDKHFIYFTRKSIGMEAEPVDKIIFCTPSPKLKLIYNKFLKDHVININGKEIIGSTPPARLHILYMLEGGTLKVTQNEITTIVPIKDTTKIDIILDTFGDDSSNVIMYNYTEELAKLQQYFKKTLLLSAISFAEGIDLHKYNNLIVYSQNFSAAGYVQRRARQCNLNRKAPITVYFMLIENAVSHQVYKHVNELAVNFTHKHFEEVSI